MVHLIPLGISLAVAASLYLTVGWWGFWLIFPWIGGWITIGGLLSQNKKGKARDFGRRLAILMSAPIFLVFIGAFQRENLQLEETVFYLANGVFTRVLVHYAIAKVFGPLIWGRGFCGWACWTAAVLEWLPIKKNRPVSGRLSLLRVPALVLSLAIPLWLIHSGYDYQQHHIDEAAGKHHQLYWFLAGNALYYVLAIVLAFALKKKRACASSALCSPRRSP